MPDAQERPEVAMEICIDCIDPGVLATFWSGLLGYATDDDLNDRWVHLEPPPGLPVLNLQRVPEDKHGKNRLHFDVYVHEPELWIERSAALGATRISRHEDPEDRFQVMADPEGNEFCSCREGS